jgi:hypothetical protein
MAQITPTVKEVTNISPTTPSWRQSPACRDSNVSPHPKKRVLKQSMLDDQERDLAERQQDTDSNQSDCSEPRLVINLDKCDRKRKTSGEDLVPLDLTIKKKVSDNVSSGATIAINAIANITAPITVQVTTSHRVSSPAVSLKPKSTLDPVVSVPPTTASTTQIYKKGPGYSAMEHVFQNVVKPKIHREAVKTPPLTMSLRKLKPKNTKRR